MRDRTSSRAAIPGSRLRRFDDHPIHACDTEEGRRMHTMQRDYQWAVCAGIIAHSDGSWWDWVDGYTAGEAIALRGRIVRPDAAAIASPAASIIDALECALFAANVKRSIN